MPGVGLALCYNAAGIAVFIALMVYAIGSVADRVVRASGDPVLLIRRGGKTSPAVGSAGRS